MATYTFSGSHKSSHKTVAGQIEARDESEARQKLSRRGIELDSLTCLETPAVPPQFPNPTPAKPARPRANLTHAAVSLMALGLLWQLAATRLQQAQQATAPFQEVHLKVQAKLQPLPADLDTSQLEVHLHYPQFPLDLSRHGRELAIDSQGRFSIEQDVRLRQKPNLVRVSCRAPGWRTVEFASLPVDEETSTCQIPAIAMQKVVP